MKLIVLLIICQSNANFKNWIGYSKWIIAVEIVEIIHKDGFYMARQWSYPRNLEKMFKPNLNRRIKITV